MPVKICKGSAWQVMFPVPVLAPISSSDTSPGPEMMEKYATDISPGIDIWLSQEEGRHLSLSSQRSHVKKVVSCWDKNRMTVIRSDSCDHWLVTESLFTLSSTIKSSLSDAMPFTYFLPIFQTAYCLCFISGHTWLLALNSFLTWLDGWEVEIICVLWSRPQSDILPLKAHILTPYSLFRQQKPAELIDESL